MICLLCLNECSQIDMSTTAYPGCHHWLCLPCYQLCKPVICPFCLPVVNDLLEEFNQKFDTLIYSSTQVHELPELELMPLLEFEEDIGTKENPIVFD